MLALLTVVAVSLGIAVVVLAVLLARARRRIVDLEERLTARPRSPLQTAGRAVKAVVDTAVRARDDGMGTMLVGSIQEFSRWAAADRVAIERVAAPDGTVTILFSDIEDSTAHNERLGDARWVRVLGAHDRLVRRHVAAHAGHVVKTQGDGFMVVFGDVTDGVRAALAIQGELTGGPTRRLRRTQVAVRIGMHCGRVVSKDGDYFGRNVAMAARIAAHARGGEIVVSDDVAAALRQVPEIAVDPVGDVELKGLTGAHPLWLVGAGTIDP